MKKYNLHQIMATAHAIYRKYFKLYHHMYGVETFSDCLRVAWADKKKRVAAEEARNAEKEAMKAALANPAPRSSYDFFNAPTSAYYTDNNRGLFGAHYVGD